MTYSVLTTVSNEKYLDQRFYLYKTGSNGLTNFSEAEASELKDILEKYSDVFSDSKIVPREDEEIKTLNPENADDNLDFTFEDVFDDCPGIQEELEETFDNMICGIDREETVRQTMQD